MSRGRKTKIETDILRRMPTDILLKMTNKEISQVFNVNEGQVSTILTQKMEAYEEKIRETLTESENRLTCKGAWMNSPERKFIKQIL